MNAISRDPKGYFAALGLDPTADAAQVKAAYRERAKSVHPDHNPHPEAEVAFQRISEAYRVLRDPLRRLDYLGFGDSAVPSGPVRLQPCSKCGKTSAQPRFLVFHQVKSFLLSTRSSSITGIFCPACAEKTAVTASALTWAQGWWGPVGLVLSPVALLRNLMGGTKPKAQNFTLLLNQARAFSAAGRGDVARGVLAQARRFVQEPQDKASLEALITNLGASPRRLKNHWQPFNKGFLLQFMPLMALAGVVAAAVFIATRSL